MAPATEAAGAGRNAEGLARTTLFLLTVAVGLRALVFVVLGPTGHDDHYAVIDLILEHHRIPASGATAQSFHPPAYYLLGVPWALVGGPRGVQVLSLLLAVTNVWLLFGLVEALPAAARIHSFLLIALLPQFVLYGLLVSNDTLAMLVGTLAIVVALRFEAEPSLRNACLSGVAAGVGLLTKGTLLAHAAVLGTVVAVVSLRRLGLRQALLRVTLFAALTLGIGAYKFVENQIGFGRPIVHNMDFSQGWIKAQRPTVTSAGSFVNFDLTRLFREPHGERPPERRSEPGGTNPQSVPLLLYATFWHPYSPVSNFRGTFEHQPWLARATYVAAVPVTLLVLGGLAIAVRRRPVLVAFLAANVAVVVAAGVRYDAWSSFNSRLILPSMASLALALAYGIGWLQHRLPRLLPAVHALGGALYALFLVYFGLEILHVVRTVLG